MWNYETSVEWKEGKQGVVRCGGKPDIAVATPPEFGGPEGIWTPEDMLTGSVESCVVIDIDLELEEPTRADDARNALIQAEKNYPLSNTLSCPVELVLNIA
ncbi:MAG TPA: hypothetical protein VJ904_13625 [Tichowtungia sp.]|nr:hypothetical protein [Tichowtungia sp.]